MDEFNKLVEEAANMAESKGIPFLVTYLSGETIQVVDFQPAHTPERIKRVFATAMNGVKQTKRRVEIQA